ncbi:hypothetical protein CH76_04935 [Lysinibacillus sp. BF-4]|uniref:DUF1659 domain-containing protein n=1 Tax=Lysinibacillus sp. BF-4 TaxID=1473546 RepID=UPI0005050546|nr:DUF1659 domain-containing protein [Lysinibacillus sp. BF-4]KFL43775.1 hypothetical protein CH76_04935 [Lysinibacillus sp. BF-4]
MAKTYVLGMALRIAYDHGMDAADKQIVKTASYTKINAAATATDLLTAAQTVAGLSAHPVHNITKVTTEAITN